MEKKQTAVQWLYDRLKLSLPEEMKVLRGLVVVAKEMEKEQIIKARQDIYTTGNLSVEQYYNETYQK